MVPKTQLNTSRPAKLQQTKKLCTTKETESRDDVNNGEHFETFI